MLGTILFLLTVLILLGTIVVIVSTWIAWRRLPVRRILLGLPLLLTVYIAILLAASLLTPQTVLALRQERCFDEMCFSVTNVVMTKTIHTVSSQPATHGIFYLITVQLRNASLRTPQKPDNPSFTLVDGQGHEYAPSQQATLWNQQVQPGAIAPRVIIFNVPDVLQQPGLLIAEGGWPTILIIGDDNSLFHKKTEVLLTS